MSGSGTYDVTLNPGAQAPILATGGYCKVISAPAGQVQLKLDSGEMWTVYEGQGFRMPDGQEFSRVLVKNLATLAQLILVTIGDALFEDTRITGNVRVIDQGADKTTAGNQYLGMTRNVPDAVKCSMVGILAGAKPIYIKRLAVGASVGTAMRFFTSTGAPTDTAFSAAMFNKALGGAAAAALRYSAVCVADPPTGTELPGVSAQGYVNVLQNQMLEVPLTTPIKIPANTGFFVISVTGSTYAYMTADCEE